MVFVKVFAYIMKTLLEITKIELSEILQINMEQLKYLFGFFKLLETFFIFARCSYSND